MKYKLGDLIKRKTNKKMPHLDTTEIFSVEEHRGGGLWICRRLHNRKPCYLDSWSTELAGVSFDEDEIWE